MAFAMGAGSSRARSTSIFRLAREGAATRIAGLKARGIVAMESMPSQINAVGPA